MAGLASMVALAGIVGFSTRSDAGGCGGCSGGCACGAGPKTSEIKWDDSISVPVEPDPKAAPDKTPRTDLTVEDLKSGKPLLVYYFVDGLTDAKDDSYKLSQRFEMTGLAADNVLSSIKNGWRAKKVPLDAKAARKDPKNQARIEFWAFTGAKMSEIAAKDENQADAKPLLAKLTTLATKNRDLCAKEIKRIEDAAKAPPATGK